MKVLEIKTKMGEKGILIREDDLEVWKQMLYDKGLFCQVIASYDYGYILRLKYKKKYMPLMDEVLKVFSSSEEAKEAWDELSDKDKYNGYEIIQLGAD